MKLFVIAIAGVLVVVPQIFARDQSLLARVTVYWANGDGGSDYFTQHHKCATGLRLQTGHCAVDPRKIPYGSQVVFPDGSALAAVDTGRAVRNREAARKSGRTVYECNALVVDRFFETKRQALSWASRNPPFMTVRVVPPHQGAMEHLTEQPQPRAMVAQNLPPVGTSLQVSIPLAFNRQLTASDSTVAKNPLNRMGR